jgi:hypothetical protein
MFHQLVLKAIPILLYLDEKQTVRPKLSTPDMNNIKIENLIQIQPLDLDGITRGPEIMEELERDLMLEKIVTHAAVHYFIAVHLKKFQSEEIAIECKILLKRAISICYSFLPIDSHVYQSIAFAWDKCKNIGVNRVRSVSRMKSQGRIIKSDTRSASTNKFRPSPTRKPNDTNKELSTKQTDQTITPLRRKIIGKFKKMKVK